jgi:hypothetical protein
MSMKNAVILALGMLLVGCAPPPPPGQVAMRPVALDPATVRECASIQSQIAEQQRHAALGSIMATPLVQAAVQINAYNVIDGLRTRAAMIGCI